MVKQIVRAAHINGSVKCALLRSPEDVASTVARLESAGYWTGISVESFVPQHRNARKGAW